MALLDIPAIKQVAVVPRDDLGKDKRLVAYVVPQPDQALTTGEMRALLKDKLPSYMLPSAFVMLDSLPLTASGKVDRRALPPPPKSREKADTSYAAANTLVEKVLVKLWADTMGIEDVGIHESTVSRAISNKYVATPRGIYALKQFFTTGLKGRQGQRIKGGL